MGIVIHLQPQAHGVKIVPLTPALVHRLKGQATEALNGDGSCSLKTMSTSCFASENCSKGYSSLELDMMLGQPYAFVAVSDIAPDGQTRLDSEAFVGCVTAGPCPSSVRRMFPDFCAQPGDLMLSNLCVADAYRAHGVGRLLVDTILAQRRHPRVFLLIARHGERSADPNIASVFGDRVPRLRKTYHRLGFTVQDECLEAALLCHQTKA